MKVADLNHGVGAVQKLPVELRDIGGAAVRGENRGAGFLRREGFCDIGTDGRKCRDVIPADGVGLQGEVTVKAGVMDAVFPSVRCARQSGQGVPRPHRIR